MGGSLASPQRCPGPPGYSRSQGQAKEVQLAMRQCTFLGHQVGGGELRMELAKVEAISAFQTPKTKRDVRSFLGLVGYYRRFVPQFAALTAKLTDSTRKDRPNKVNWTSELQHDFIERKKALTSEPVLACPNWDTTFILHTDTSGRGIGAELSEKDSHGCERPTAFFSHRGKRYTQRWRRNVWEWWHH